MDSSPLPGPSESPNVKTIPDSLILITAQNKVLPVECLKFLRDNFITQVLGKTLFFQTPQVFLLFEDRVFHFYGCHHRHHHVFIITTININYVHNSEHLPHESCWAECTQLARYICSRHLPSENFTVFIGRRISALCQGTTPGTHLKQRNAIIRVIGANLLCS